MKALHPYIPVIAAGLILIGASTVGPDAMAADPVAVPVSPAMNFDEARPHQDVSDLTCTMTSGPKRRHFFQWNAKHYSFPRVPYVTAAPDRFPFHQSDDRNKQPGIVKQPAMLSKIVRLETAGGQAVRLRNDAWLPAAMQRMMHSNAAYAA